MQRSKIPSLALAVAAAAVLALAGGGQAFLRKPVGAAFIALWLVWWSTLILGWRRGSPPAEARAPWFVTASGAGMLLTTLLLLPWEYTRLSGPLPRDGLLSWAGMALFAAGIGVQIVTFKMLGALFAPRRDVKTPYRLVTRGLYRVVRHPTYVGYLCTFTGMALALSSVIGLGLAGLIAVLLVRLVPHEEAMLEAMFPEAYPAYRQQTRWRLVPWVY